MEVTVCVKESQLRPLGGTHFAVNVSDTSVLSVQPDGSFQTRPNTAIGPWETGIRDGNKLIYSEERYAMPGSYAILIVTA